MLQSPANHHVLRAGRPLLSATLLAGLCVVHGAAYADHTRIKGLLDLALPELMSVRVLSLSKTSQSVWDAAAAVTVVDQRDIRASGATTIADVLRLVPGVQVGQVDAGGFAVSIRGFTSRTARKVLVMIDGRTIYSQGFSGTFWELRDLPLQIIDRIEVLRGPGGTLWGSNAMNGVINIITKPAHLNPGTELSVGGGNELRGVGYASHSGRLFSHLHGRAYAQYKSADASWLEGRARDDFIDQRAGFRLDTEGKIGHVLTVQGEIFQRDGGTAPPVFSTETDGEADGGHLLMRWRHSEPGGVAHQVQAFFNHSSLLLKAIGGLRESIADLEYQFSYTGWESHDLVLGLGYRKVRDDLDAMPNVPLLRVEPQRSKLNISHAYAQDRIHLPYGLHLTLGARAENNVLSGTDIQPTARIDWAPENGSTVWASWSRAKRTPSRFEAELANRPNRDLNAEKMEAIDLGLRHRIATHATLEIAAFRNRYDELIAPEPDVANSPPAYVKHENAMRGKTWGFEVEARWDPRPHWELRSGYSRLAMDLEAKPGFVLFAAPVNRFIPDLIENSDPEHRLFVQSRNEIGANWQLDSTLRHVSGIDSDVPIPAYTELDLAAVWAPRPGITLDVIGRNLLDSRHPEASGAPFTGNTEIERSVLLRGTWKY